MSWEIACQEIARELNACAPHEAVVYTSGRAALETSYMYPLFARIHGSNHLPDSANMCHESSSVALPQSIGRPVDTVTLEDFDRCDCIFVIGQNVGTASPWMLHPLQEAAKRGVAIVTINPLRERGLERFTNPQSPVEKLTCKETPLSTLHLQVKIGGDIAALMGICKAVIEIDDTAAENDAGGRGQGRRAVDHAFIAEHTHGFEAFVAAVRGHDWAELEHVSGLPRAQMESAGAIYARSSATLGIYGMGLTQHAQGVHNVHMVTNLLLLRGNIGRPGAGICAVRGHSNVQGQRTVGITEKPELVPLDRLAAQHDFAPPRWKGHSTVEACAAIHNSEVKAWIGLGGNPLRAVPETAAVEAGWRRLRLTVQIATKLNRSHVLHGGVAYLLPCPGRSEIDRQVGVAQAATIESSMGQFHGSRGVVEPASPDLRSEPWIVAAMAKSTLAGKGRVPWDAWAADCRGVRNANAATYPEMFAGFNQRPTTLSRRYQDTRRYRCA